MEDIRTKQERSREYVTQFLEKYILKDDSHKLLAAKTSSLDEDSSLPVTKVI